MSKAEIETIIRTENGTRLSIDQWDDGAVWLHVSGRQFTTHFVLSREEAEQAVAGLQRILEAKA